MQTTSFATLLQTAVTQPGRISTAYSAFHTFSLGNQLLALGQTSARGLQPGPLATYNRWRELGRQVRKGEKALTLCMPVTVKRIEETEDGAEEHAYTRFVYRPNWFVMAQTEGADLAPTLPPSWDRAKALQTLGIEEIPFDLLDGNVMGYARGRQVSVSPVCPFPIKTLIHEIAHVLHGHCAESVESDSEHTPRSIREVEAEGVALLVLGALGLDGLDFCRGYLQHWLQGAEIPEKSAQRIFKVADQILKAGEVRS